MEQCFEEAFYEVEEIIKLLPNELVKKIPKSFIQIITENKSKTYKRKEITLDNIESLKIETRVILYQMYRDFFLSNEEAEKAKIEENRFWEEQYSYDKIFSNTKVEKESDILKKELIEYKEPKWYLKIIEFLKFKLKF